MKRKNGEGSWGQKNFKGVPYVYYRNTEGTYFYEKTAKEVKEKIKKSSKVISKTDTLKNYGINRLKNVKATELE